MRPTRDQTNVFREAFSLRRIESTWVSGAMQHRCFRQIDVTAVTRRDDAPRIPWKRREGGGGETFIVFTLPPHFLPNTLLQLLCRLWLRSTRNTLCTRSQITQSDIRDSNLPSTRKCYRMLLSAHFRARVQGSKVVSLVVGERRNANPSIVMLLRQPTHAQTVQDSTSAVRAAAWNVQR